MVQLKFRKRAFTLVELLIALIIIGILAGALLLTVANAQAKTEATKVASDLRNLKSATILYYVDKGKIPETRGSAGWSLWSATALQPYVDMDLSKYRLSGINSDGVTTSSFESNAKKGYSLYIMGAGSGGMLPRSGNLSSLRSGSVTSRSRPRRHWKRWPKAHRYSTGITPSMSVSKGLEPFLTTRPTQRTISIRT